MRNKQLKRINGNSQCKEGEEKRECELYFHNKNRRKVKNKLARAGVAEFNKKLAR